MDMRKFIDSLSIEEQKELFLRMNQYNRSSWNFNEEEIRRQLTDKENNNKMNKFANDK